MKRLEFYKAYSGPRNRVNPVELGLVLPLEMYTTKPPHSIENLYDVQGFLLCETLCETLPGGTVERLLLHLMTRRALLITSRWPPIERDPRLPIMDDQEETYAALERMEREAHRRTRKLQGETTYDLTKRIKPEKDGND